ncbi:MAG: 1,4-beta-N-acetylmuramidase, partial [[Eubacterium] saphenum]|nr:1,4-beta-N-acetylmuramidase [[Eubacterium] saphenum]
PLKKSVDELAREVINGKWSVGAERKALLTAAGYSYEAVQKRVNELLYPPRKTIAEVAEEVVAGKWGAGLERFRRLTEAGYDYYAVQRRVNQILYK